MSAETQTETVSKVNGNGAGRVPRWLADLGVKEGGYYTTSKARTNRMMTHPLTAEARQVYACLELATMGFQQEKAVTMDRGKIVPLRSEHICASTGHTKQHVRRALEELEEAGLAERRSVNGAPLTQGNIEIFSWAIPRETERSKGESGSHRAATIFAKLSPRFDSLVRFAKYNKITPSEEFDDETLVAERGYAVEKALVAVAEVEKAELVAIALVKTVFAPATGSPRYKEGNKQKETSERNVEAGGRASVVVESPPEPPARPPEPPSPEPQTAEPKPDLLRTELARRNLKPDEPWLRRIRATLAECPLPYFLEMLDQRLERGKIGTGLLIDLAQAALDSFRLEPATSPPAPAVTCAKCQKPIEPGESVINGQCGDCFILSSA